MTTFREGLNAPSPVTRVLILGYYDGATHGVLQLGEGGCAYRFDYEDGDDERTFELRPLPFGSLSRLESVIGEHIAPKWPTWMPGWKFPSVEIEREVGTQVDAILNRAGPVEWQIDTRDPIRFQSLIARPVVAERAVAI